MFLLSSSHYDAFIGLILSSVVLYDRNNSLLRRPGTQPTYFGDFVYPS